MQVLDYHRRYYFETAEPVGKLLNCGYNKTMNENEYNRKLNRIYTLMEKPRLKPFEQAELETLNVEVTEYEEENYPMDYTDDE